MLCNYMTWLLCPFQGGVRFNDVGISENETLRVMQYRDVIDGEDRYRSRQFTSHLTV